MVFPELEAEEQLLLCPQDFPDNYTKDYCHPEDYKVFEHAVEKQLMFNHRQGKFNRLLLRACWRTAHEKYIPMTFVLDTGACGFLFALPENKNTSLSTPMAAVPSEQWKVVPGFDKYEAHTEGSVIGKPSNNAN